MKTKEYQQYCPVAGSLDVVGEKWALLVVRDLLRGPQRFTELLASLAGITPKWLTQRLRDLEAEGIVERDGAPGRREVWYRLTEKGRDLGPVVSALAAWGMVYTMRPPLPGESVSGTAMTVAWTAWLNRWHVRLDRPAVWVVALDGRRPFTLQFDGEHWHLQRGDAGGDLRIQTDSRTWATLLTVPADQRRALAAELTVEGDPARVAELLDVLEARPAERAAAV
jgi:DNA-binding HxlR family transcriptional regulator